jgi:hypothetical protein
MIRMHAAIYGCAALALAMAACGEGPAEPRQPEDFVRGPAASGLLASASVRAFPYHALGAFDVWAYAADSATWAADVRVRVRTSGGGDEALDLAAMAGTLPRQILVTLREGRHVAELRGRMDAAQLRFGSFGVTGETGLLHVVGGDPAAALARVRGWPEVRSASPNALVSLAAGGGARAWPVGGALPMDEAAPAPGNGVLELRPDETATVEYRGASGEPVTVQQAYDSRSEPDIRAFVPLLVRAVERTLYGDSAAPPPLLIDAASFATAAWSSSGTPVAPSEAVAGLPAGYTVVEAPRGARCRQSVFPRDCADVAAGTFIYTSGMFRTAVNYEMVANFRSPRHATRVPAPAVVPLHVERRRVARGIVRHPQRLLIEPGIHAKSTEPAENDSAGSVDLSRPLARVSRSCGRRLRRPRRGRTRRRRPGSARAPRRR